MAKQQAQGGGNQHSSAKLINCSKCKKDHPRQLSHYCQTCDKCFHHRSLHDGGCCPECKGKIKETPVSDTVANIPGRADDDRGGFSAGEEEDRAEERERRWHVEHWRKLLKTGVCGA